MIVKNGFNIMFFVFIMFSAGTISCKSGEVNQQKGALMEADRAFSALSEKEGMIIAFLEYIADDGVVLRDNSYPSAGKSELVKYYEGKSDTSFTLIWEPLFEKLAEGGDMGYTYGIYTHTINATGAISKGTYTTVWQKQSDGRWKWVLDTGNQGLPEQK